MISSFTAKITKQKRIPYDLNIRGFHVLKRGRKTRYKNTQLVVRHCCVASLGRCFCAFHLARSACCATNIYCGMKKAVAKSRARVYFERQRLALLLVFFKVTTCHATNLRQVAGFCVSYFAAFSHTPSNPLYQEKLI